MTSNVVVALDAQVDCPTCGATFVPWRAGQRCPLCTTPASVDPLDAALSPRQRHVRAWVVMWWRIVLLVFAWLFVLTTIAIVWRAP